jgi:hypothetical protein
LGRLPKLRAVKFNQKTGRRLGSDFFKFMQKGMSYMHKEGRQLEMLTFDNILGAVSKEHLFGVLKNHPNLICLKINRGTLSIDDAKAVGKILADFKCIRELDVSNSGLNLQTTKEIADGLMRAKQLEIFRAGSNPAMGVAVNTVLYNLAFSPKIKMIELSNLTGTNRDTGEALYKLLKISGAIETLLMQNTGVSFHLTEDFFKALGENKTIVYLNLDEKTPCTFDYLMAKAIAMNSYKNGSLEAVSMVNWI